MPGRTLVPPNWFEPEHATINSRTFCVTSRLVAYAVLEAEVAKILGRYADSKAICRVTTPCQGSIALRRPGYGCNRNIV
jgi:hypothetical protein